MIEAQYKYEKNNKTKYEYQKQKIRIMNKKMFSDKVNQKKSLTQLYYHYQFFRFFQILFQIINPRQSNYLLRIDSLIIIISIRETEQKTVWIFFKIQIDKSIKLKYKQNIKNTQLSMSNNSHPNQTIHIHYQNDSMQSQNQNHQSSSSQQSSPSMRPYPQKNKPKFKINKKVNQVKLKLKRGRDTPDFHVRNFFKYWEEFKHLYEKNKEYPKLQEKALKKIKRVMDSQKKYNTDTLWLLFGGNPPDADASEEVKEEFILNRTNALVLEQIYKKYEMEIVFGSPKIEDKLSYLAFIREYRKRLPNPLLCGKIQCPRPKLPQRKGRKQQQNQGDSDQFQNQSK